MGKRANSALPSCVLAVIIWLLCGCFPIVYFVGTIVVKYDCGFRTFFNYNYDLSFRVYSAYGFSVFIFYYFQYAHLLCANKNGVKQQFINELLLDPDWSFTSTLLLVVKLFFC